MKAKRNYGGMRVVITYGTFDLFHFGHYRLLKRAAELGDYLIVAVSTDAFNRVKGKACVHPYRDRVRTVNALPFVDKVIPESDWKQKMADLDQYGVQVLVMGDDWAGTFDYLNPHCKVVYLPRTRDISSTQIKQFLALNP
jgi:glycerol-3-phosphate cytidylyltransferase